MTAKGKGKAGVMAHDPLADMDPETPQQTAKAAADAEAAPGDEAEAPECVALGDSLTIADVGELRERLRGGLDLGGTLNIDAGDVEQVDAAGIQLLCAVARDARNQGLDVAWTGVSDRLAAAVRQLGLEDELPF